MTTANTSNNNAFATAEAANTINNAATVMNDSNTVKTSRTHSVSALVIANAVMWAVFFLSIWAGNKHESLALFNVATVLYCVLSVTSLSGVMTGRKVVSSDHAVLSFIGQALTKGFGIVALNIAGAVLIDLLWHQNMRTLNIFAMLGGLALPFLLWGLNLKLMLHRVSILKTILWVVEGVALIVAIAL